LLVLGWLGPEGGGVRGYERARFARCGTQGGSWTMIADL
jgi:hypothetical protein